MALTTSCSMASIVWNPSVGVSIITLLGLGSQDWMNLPPSVACLTGLAVIRTHPRILQVHLVQLLELPVGR